MNNQSQRVVTESADFVGEQQDSFVGEYRSTWFDKIGQTMILSITVKNINLNILSLRWSVNQTTHFVGEGFINNDVLIGAYYDGELDGHIKPLLNK